MPAHLTGLKGIHWGQSLPLGETETSIGREAGNSIVCDGDSKVSRRHARILPAGSNFAIEDLGSSNGTFINGARITSPTVLHAGDEIRIGGQSYRFESTEPSPYAPPSGSPAVQRPREVSRGEQAKAGWTRGSERIYGGAAGDLGGCAMPNLPDLTGCLRMLMMLLIAFVAIAIIGGLLMLLSSGIGALGGIGAGGHGGSAQTGAGGGQQQTGGPEQTKDKSGKGIRIKSVRLAGSKILVSWENGTDQKVHKIWANLRLLDASGAVLGTWNDVVVYDGKAVDPGAFHQDSLTAGEGFDQPPTGTVKAASGMVDVTSYD